MIMLVTSSQGFLYNCMAKPFGRVMYLMQQLEKIFNETTLCANVARLRRFAL
jgi:hypothetical protein